MQGLPGLTNMAMAGMSSMDLFPPLKLGKDRHPLQIRQQRISSPMDPARKRIFCHSQSQYTDQGMMASVMDPVMACCFATNPVTTDCSHYESTNGTPLHHRFNEDRSLYHRPGNSRCLTQVRRGTAFLPPFPYVYLANKLAAPLPQLRSSIKGGQTSSVLCRDRDWAGANQLSPSQAKWSTT